MEGMGFVCRHDDHLAFLENVLSLLNGDLRVTINNRGNCIERCGMFRQAFAGIEGEESYGPALFIDDHTADNGSFLVSDKVFGIKDLSGEVFVWFFGHGITYASLLVQVFIKTLVRLVRYMKQTNGIG
jgi:hypothetical protein